MHCEEFLSLHISSLHVLLWPVNYASRVSDDCQGICVDCLDLVPLIELALQDQSCSLMVLTVHVVAFLAASLWFPCDSGIPRYL